MNGSSTNGDQDGRHEMDPRDEARLSDWIEGEAGAADAAAVESLLREDPVLAARVEAIAADRRRLRSLAPVTVPAEVRAAIDDRVARTLLLQSPHASVPSAEAAGSQTADWRRRRHRRTIERRWAVLGGSLAGAAVLVLGVSSLRTWLGSPAGPRMPESDLVAAARDTGSATGPVAADPATAFQPSADAMVMHGLPLRTSAPTDAVAAASPRPSSGPGDPVPAIRVRGLTPESLEAALLAMVDAGDAPSRIAITRNLTTRTLARMAPRAAGRDAEPLWTALDQDRRPGEESWRSRVDRRVQDVWDRETDRQAADGRVLAGSEQDRPGWAEQIVFSEAGAAWTVSVPASRIGEVLAALDREAGVEAGSSLAQLDAVRSRLLEDAEAWRAARERLRRLAAETPDRIVHLPVVLQAP